VKGIWWDDDEGYGFHVSTRWFHWALVRDGRWVRFIRYIIIR